MTHPSDDELARLLLGEAPPQALGAPSGHPEGDTGPMSAALFEAPFDAPAVAAHVEACRRCQDVMAELADVELLLGRFGDTEFVDPPAALWERIARSTSHPLPSALEPAPEDPVVIPLARTRRPRGGSGRQLLVAAAAAVLVLAGVGIGRFTAGPPAGPPTAAPTITITAPSPPTGSSPTRLGEAVLTSLDGARRLGTAQVVRADAHTTLVVRPDPMTPPAESYVEVWLLNTDGKRMISVGVLEPGRDVSLGVPQDALVQGYRVVDLSVERYDGNPAHSGDSIMRGNLLG